MKKINKLSDLKQGESAIVSKLSSKGKIRRRLQDIGIVEGTNIECIQKSPLGDPIPYFIRGAVIALRSEDSSEIYVECEI